LSWHSSTPAWQITVRKQTKSNKTGAVRAVDTVDLSLNGWLLATAIASTILLLEEARKRGSEEARKRGSEEARKLLLALFGGRPAVVRRQ